MTAEALREHSVGLRKYAEDHERRYIDMVIKYLDQQAREVEPDPHTQDVRAAILLVEAAGLKLHSHPTQQAKRAAFLR